MQKSWIKTDNCDMCAGISVPVLLCCNQLKKNLVIGWGKKSSQRTLFTRNQCQ